MHQNRLIPSCSSCHKKNHKSLVNNIDIGTLKEKRQSLG